MGESQHAKLLKFMSKFNLKVITISSRKFNNFVINVCAARGNIIRGSRQSETNSRLQTSN